MKSSEIKKYLSSSKMIVDDSRSFELCGSIQQPPLHNLRYIDLVDQEA